MRIILPLVLSLCLLWSCENTTEAPIPFGYEYFPLQTGNSWTYQVDSTVFDTTGMGRVVTESSSQIREQIVDQFISNEGNEVFRIERSWRRDDSEAWTTTDVWTAERTENRAFKTEENLRYIKMVFPLSENEVWDGLRFIDKTQKITVAGETLELFKNWQHQLISIGLREQIGPFTFEEVSTVSEADSENLIELRFAREKYAKAVGLVYKEMRILDTQNINDQLSWEDKAQKGFILRQTLIDFSN
ncbi:MAG: hypothetical protein AAFO94_00010 [Bacteroidota bacterium]